MYEYMYAEVKGKLCGSPLAPFGGIWINSGLQLTLLPLYLLSHLTSLYKIIFFELEIL